MKRKENISQYPTAPSLVGKKIYLRPTMPEDIKDTHLWFLVSEPQAQTCQPVAIISTEEKIERIKKKTPSNDSVVSFIIAGREDHRSIGKLTYFNLNLLNRSAELGYIVAPEERGKGFAKDSLKLLIGYLFSELKLNKVYAHTGSFNTASIKLLESLGFRHDGTLRQHHLHKGEMYDDLIYSLLKFECNF